jgi:hypothetical protein
MTQCNKYFIVGISNESKFSLAFLFFKFQFGLTGWNEWMNQVVLQFDFYVQQFSLFQCIEILKF